MRVKWLIGVLVIMAAIVYAGVQVQAPLEQTTKKLINDSVGEQRNVASAQDSTGKKLVVYFSYTGNTRAVAQQISRQVNGTLYEIQPATAYSKDYDTVVAQGKEEVNNGYRPPLAGTVENLSSYDVIYVGSPIWWYTIAPPVASFLADANLAGKKIIPFVTHGGYGAGHSIEDIQKLCPKAEILEPLVLEGKDSGNSEQAIADWLKRLKL